MNMSFDEFVRIVRNGIATGEVKVSKELSDFDLAVNFAVGRIGEKRGYPCEMTIEEIGTEISEFAPELMKGEPDDNT